MTTTSGKLRVSDTVRIRAKLREVPGATGSTWFFTYNLRGMRIKSPRFKDREVASFEMRKIVDQYEAKTPYQATTLTREQLDDAQGAFLTLKQNKVENTLGEIVTWYLTKGPRCEPITLADAVDKFLGTLDERMKRKQTIVFYTRILGRLKKELGKNERDEARQLTELTTEDFRVYLSNPSWGTISQWHHRQVASRLYLWAMKQKPRYASENPLDPLPKMTKRGLSKVLDTPLVMTPAEARLWLKAAIPRRQIAFSVLSIFAGMRRQEIQLFARLPKEGWGDIDLGSEKISIPARIGKTGKRTIVMHKTLVLWLKWLQKNGHTDFAGPNLNKALRAIKAEAFESDDEEVKKKTREPNIARHSYITYAVRLPGASFAHVAMNAGNTEQVIRGHYNDIDVTEKEASEFWSITPQSLKI